MRSYPRIASALEEARDRHIEPIVRTVDQRRFGPTWYIEPWNGRRFVLTWWIDM